MAGAVLLRTVAQDRTIEEREVLAYVRGFEERTMEDRGYALSHEEHGEVLEGAMALQSRRSPIGGETGAPPALVLSPMPSQSARSDSESHARGGWYR